jgi:hypothetical protein
MTLRVTGMWLLAHMSFSQMLIFFPDHGAEQITSFLIAGTF